MAREYELLPTDDIEELKKEINKLKRVGLGESDNASGDASGINKLNNSINSLVELFKTAKDSMEIEEKEHELVAQQLGPLMEKIDILIDQNRRIAQGIITVADMIKAQSRESAPFIPRPIIRPTTPFTQNASSMEKEPFMPQPNIPMQPRQQTAPGMAQFPAPRFNGQMPQPPSMSSFGPMPPPPPPPKKKGVFGR